MRRLTRRFGRFVLTWFATSKLLKKAYQSLDDADEDADEQTRAIMGMRETVESLDSRIATMTETIRGQEKEIDRLNARLEVATMQRDAMAEAHAGLVERIRAEASIQVRRRIGGRIPEDEE